MKHLPYLFVLILIGCNNRPTEMPNTIPCQITIVNDGTPQVAYEVGLHALGGNGALSIHAKTNSSGIAEIRTQFANYIAKGAPAGTYKVTVEKHIALSDDGVDTSRFSEEEEQTYFAKRAAEAEKQRVVPVQLTRSSTTPFEITLEPGGKSHWVFDLKEYLGCVDIGEGSTNLYTPTLSSRVYLSRNDDRFAAGMITLRHSEKSR